MCLEQQINPIVTFVRLLYDPSKRLPVERLTARTNVVRGNFAGQSAENQQGDSGEITESPPRKLFHFAR